MGDFEFWNGAFQLITDNLSDYNFRQHLTFKRLFKYDNLRCSLTLLG